MGTLIRVPFALQLCFFIYEKGSKYFAYILGECDFQAMPQLTDRSKLPTIIDPVIRNTMDPKHLYQVISSNLI